MKFAMIEQKLGEIPRARAIFTHLSQFCDPSKPEGIESFWKFWEEFETSHGNEDTFSEMMRTKRSVSSRFSLNAPLFVVESKVPV
jgi:pre-mRNA-splicing factor SYF1